MLYSGRYAAPLARDIQASGGANGSLLRARKGSDIQHGAQAALPLLRALEPTCLAGGVITAADLAVAAPTISQPIRSAAACIARDLAPRASAVVTSSACSCCRQRVWGLDWIAAPPPSSAVTVLAALSILEGGVHWGQSSACRALSLAEDCTLPPCAAGYERPLAGSGSLGVHRTVEALKHAFALRMSLGECRWGS